MWFVPNPGTGRKPLPCRGLLHYELQVFILTRGTRWQEWLCHKMGKVRPNSPTQRHELTHIPHKKMHNTLHTGETQKYQHLFTIQKKKHQTLFRHLVNLSDQTFKFLIFFTLTCQEDELIDGRNNPEDK